MDFYSDLIKFLNSKNLYIVKSFVMKNVCGKIYARVRGKSAKFKWSTFFSSEFVALDLFFLQQGR